MSKIFQETPDPKHQHFFDVIDTIETAKNKRDLTVVRYIHNSKNFEENYNEFTEAIENQIKLEQGRLVTAKKSNDAETQIKLSHNIFELEQEKSRLKQEIISLEKQAKYFIKPIEEASSLQEVDFYISLIEEEESVLFGNLDASDNPIALTKLLKFLKEKEKEAIAKQAPKTLTESTAKVVTAKAKESSYAAIREFSAWIPDSLEGWAHENISLAELQDAIKHCEEKIKISIENSIIEKPLNEREIFRDKLSALHSLREYAETSKSNFNKRLFRADILHINASLFSSLAGLAAVISATGKIFTAIPGFNLVADGIRKGFEMLTFSSLTAAYTLDPRVPKSDRIASIRHYEALKKYDIAEASFGVLGTLSLAAGFLLPVIPQASLTLAALPFLSPALILAGTAIMTISNAIGCLSSYREMQHLQEILNEQPLNQSLADIKEKYQRLKMKSSIQEKLTPGGYVNLEVANLLYEDIPDLTTEEMKLLRASAMYDAQSAQFWSKLGNTLGTAALTLTAAAAFAAALIFPPVTIALAIITALVSIVSVIKMHQEKVGLKESFKLNQRLENYTLTKAISDLKRESRIKIEPEIAPMVKPKVGSKVKSEMEAIPYKKLKEGKKEKRLQKSKRQHSKTVVPTFTHKIDKNTVEELEPTNKATAQGKKDTLKTGKPLKPSTPSNPTMPSHPPTHKKSK